MTTRALLRRAWRLPAVLGWIGCGLVLSIAAALAEAIVPSRAAHLRAQLCQGWMHGLVWLLPLKVRCHGSVPDRTALWLSNHISWLDIVLIGRLAPLHFLSKAEVAHWPVIGWLARGAGTLFIRRGQAGGQSLNDQLSQVLKAGRSLVVFPEGTTTSGEQVKTFHGRLLAGAIDAAVPLQPTAISYRRDGKPDLVAPFINDDEFTAHLWRLLGSERIDVDIHLLPLIDSSCAPRNELARCARDRVLEALALRDQSPPTSLAPSVASRAA